MSDLKEKRERREFLSEKNLEEMRNEEERAQYQTNVKKHNRCLTVSYATFDKKYLSYLYMYTYERSLSKKNKQKFAPLFF